MSIRYTKPLLRVGFVLAIAIALVPPILAHGGPGHGYHDGQGMYFDPDTLTTFTGVLREHFGPWQVRGHGNHTGGGMAFEFESEGGDEYDLMLAPDWFLEEAGVSLDSGEQVTITGSALEVYDNGRHRQGGPGHHDDAETYLVVTVLEADGVTVQLRDEDGYPLWRGGPGWGGSGWFDPDAVTTMNGTLRETLGLWSA